MKKIVCLVSVILCTVLLFSGCVNATYTFQVHRNGSLDADYKILFDSKTTDPADLNTLMLEMRKHFTEDGYEIVDYEEHGFSGIRVSKKQVKPEELAKPGKADEKNVDYSSVILKDFSVTKGKLTNRFALQSTVDLTFLTESFLEQAKQEHLPETVLTEGTTQEVSGVYQSGNVTVIDHTETSARNSVTDRSPNVTVDDREIQQTTEKPAPIAPVSTTTKLLANATMKVVVQFPDRVTDSNAGKVSEDGKTLEWILIPGTVNELTAQGQYTNTVGLAVAWTVLGATVLVLACVLFVLLKKKRP